LANFKGVIVVQKLAGCLSHDGIAIKVEALCRLSWWGSDQRGAVASLRPAEEASKCDESTSYHLACKLCRESGSRDAEF
jgi:hypothetical protein